MNTLAMSTQLRQGYNTLKIRINNMAALRYLVEHFTMLHGEPEEPYKKVAREMAQAYAQVNHNQIACPKG